MNEWIMMDQKAGRLVKMGRVEPFEGMVLPHEDVGSVFYDNACPTYAWSG